MSTAAPIRIHRRIATALFVILTTIAGVLLVALLIVTLRLGQIQRGLNELRDDALPRLVKLSQLSQDAAATISIAPALSASATRFEFETLLSRISDKETSQAILIDELAALIADPASAETLRRNGRLLQENLHGLAGVVSDQIAMRKELEAHLERLRALAAGAASTAATGAGPDAAGGAAAARWSELEGLADSAAFAIQTMLLDPNSARLSRNRSDIEARVARLGELLGAGEAAPAAVRASAVDAARALLGYWAEAAPAVLGAKEAALANDFQIKALVEENSLLATRFLGTVSTEFWRVNDELQQHVAAVATTATVTMVTILLVVVGLGAGNFLVWWVLRQRVFRRLTRLRNALEAFAETRQRAPADPVADEIGAIATALAHYMQVIDEREGQLAEKTRALEQVSNQLAKYLSPQVYESIFSGRQEVKVVSNRKKLTVFFSDIAGFTEFADRIESEELTQILNLYLTEMSKIALQHGATIDKYIGDAMLVFFGDPETRGVREDALAAVEMAIAMRRRLADLRDVWRDQGIEQPLEVRMGLHTGFCTVGNFGSEDRLDYTIIGSTVNTASRLQALGAPGEILISYATFALVKDSIRCERHGEVEVRGQAYPVVAYRVIDSFAHLGGERRHFHAQRSTLTVDLKLETMSAEDRREAAAILRRALAQVTALPASGGDAPARRKA